VLKRARRSATVTAATRVSLLVLDADDMRALMEREPRIAAQVKEAANSRLEVIGAQGDIATEELE
jgi:voltage-gated potassium channel